MSELKLIESGRFNEVICDFFKDEETNDFWMTRRQIGEALEYADPNRGVRDVEKAHPNRFKGKMRSVKISHPQGGSQDTTVYNAKGVMEICRWATKPNADAFMDWVFDKIEDLRKKGFAVVENTPTDPLDFIITQAEMMKQQAQMMKQMQSDIRETKTELQTTKERVKNLDTINFEGDPRKRLKQMVTKLKFKEGISFGEAWGKFIKAFNNSYNTNLELLKTNYKKKYGKEISTPGILEERRLLSDALRVADKLLNEDISVII